MFKLKSEKEHTLQKIREELKKLEEDRMKFEESKKAWNNERRVLKRDPPINYIESYSKMKSIQNKINGSEHINLQGQSVDRQILFLNSQVSQSKSYFLIFKF